MAPHSSTLAWKIPWMEEPGRLQSIGGGPTDLGKGEVEWEAELAFLAPAFPWKPSLYQASSE